MNAGPRHQERAPAAFSAPKWAMRAPAAGMECRREAMYHPPELHRRVLEGPSPTTTPKSLQPAVREADSANGT